MKEFVFVVTYGSTFVGAFGMDVSTEQEFCKTKAISSADVSDMRTAHRLKPLLSSQPNLCIVVDVFPAILSAALYSSKASMQVTPIVTSPSLTPDKP